VEKDRSGNGPQSKNVSETILWLIPKISPNLLFGLLKCSS